MSHKRSMIVQSTFPPFVVVPPFSNIVSSIVAPPAALVSEIRGVIFHFNKRTARRREGIRLTAEVLDYNFTSAVSSRGHVERTSLFFAAVESHLSKRQECSQLFHGGSCDAQSVVVIVTDPAVCCLCVPVGWRSRTVQEKVGHKKPSPLK